MLNQQIIDDTISGLRMQRDLMLVETDWAGLTDIPTAISAKALVYRQGLRDLPGTLDNDTLVNSYADVSTLEEYKATGSLITTR